MTKAREFTEITGTITTADGKKREFALLDNAGWQQWGAERRVLGNSVDIVGAMASAVRDFAHDPEGTS